MIARYTRPEMGLIWSEPNKFAQWLEVELAASEALAELGEVPPEAARLLRLNAGFDVERIRQIEDEVKHDVIAFTTSVAETMAVAGHAEFLDHPRTTPLAKTLFAVDELSGFVMACAYVRPQGIEGMTPKSVKKKMKTPAFAAAINREELRAGAEQLGVDFDEHLAFVIAALEERSAELALDGAEPASA